MTTPELDNTISSMPTGVSTSHGLFGRAPIMFGNGLHVTTSAITVTPASHVAQFLESFFKLFGFHCSLTSWYLNIHDVAW